MDAPKNKTKGWKKILKLLLKTILWLVITVIVVCLLLLTPPVQQFVTGKATSWLESKTGTPIRIGKLYISPWGDITLKNIYVEDQQKDTLLMAGSLNVSISWSQLIGGKINIPSVKLQNITARIKRDLPDTSFNFQYIIDAFGTSENENSGDSGKSSIQLNIGTIDLSKIDIAYKDVISGNDLQLKLNSLKTSIQKINLDDLDFAVGNLFIDQLHTKFILSAPLVNIPATTAPEVISGAVSPGFKLLLNDTRVTNSQLVFNDSTTALYTNAEIGLLSSLSLHINMDQQLMDLGKITLSNTNAAIALQNNNTDTTAIISAENTDPHPALKVLLTALTLQNVKLQYDDLNAPIANSGMDYSHLNANIAQFKATGFGMLNDSMFGHLENVSLTEKSGLDLKELSTRFLYAPTEAYLKDLVIRTPGTLLKRNIAIRYPSLSSLSEDISKLYIDAQLERSQIQIKDILTFVPTLKEQPAFSNPAAIWQANGTIKGFINNLSINSFSIAGMRNTRLDINGTIKGLPAIENLVTDIRINPFTTSRQDIRSLLPANTIPESIQVPANLRLTGHLKGTMKNMLTSLQLKTTEGNMLVNGQFKNITDSIHSEYTASLSTHNLALNTLLKDTSLGLLNSTVRISGKGYTLTQAEVTANLNVHDLTYNKYTYKDIAINAALKDKLADITAVAKDSNIDLQLKAWASMADTNPAITLELNVDSIKTQPLHLTDDVLIYRGKVIADIPVLNIDSLIGKITISQSLLVNKEQRIAIDTIAITATQIDDIQTILLNSEIANLSIQGEYKLSQLPQTLIQSINPYYTISDIPKDSLLHFNYVVNGTIWNKPLLYALVPGLTTVNDIELRSRFSSDSGMNFILSTPLVLMGENQIKNIHLSGNTIEDSTLTIAATISELQSGSIQIDSTTLLANIAQNNIDFDLAIRDSLHQPKYNIGGNLLQEKNGDLLFSLKDTTLLNYENWQIKDSNLIHVASAGIHIRDFLLSKEQQQINIQSTNDSLNAPINLNINNFHISTITAMIMKDSMLVDGVLNSAITVGNLTGVPAITGDISLANIRYMTDTIGDLKATIDNSNSSSLYNLTAGLTGKDNNLIITGNYNTTDAQYNAKIDIQKLMLKTAEPFSAEMLRNSKGYLTGTLNASGAGSSPSIIGSVNFNEIGFNLATLNGYYQLDKQQIRFVDEGIQLNRFEIKDSANNTFVLNGIARTKNYTNYNFDLTARANNFKALSSTRQDNDIFYGDLFFNSNLQIKGTESAPSIDGTLTINKGTNMTVILPQSDPGVIEREGVIEFIDKDAPLNDSLFMARYDSLNTTSLSNLDLSLNIEINKDADFTLIIDESNGDALNVKGDAQLTAGIDPSGKITLVGTYELSDGSYNLSFSLVRKKFLINKGSKITWEGEPTKATVDITAKYIANTAPLDLVQGQLDEATTTSQRNYYRQKLPFEVQLNMDGQLLKPDISFDILLSEEQNLGVSSEVITNVKTKLEQLRQSTGDLTKQVFALLVLDRFVSENPFASSTGGGTNSMIRQSVSRLLTDQLNKLAEGLIQGVDINLGIESKDDYSSGEREDKTDLTVDVSKKFLDDKLVVSVGSNFALEGSEAGSSQGNNVAANINVDYQLSNDGRYKIRYYRKNNYQGVIDGYIIENGVSFIITLDYNKFSQILRSRQQQLQERRRRQQRTEQRLERNNRPDSTQQN